MAIDATWRELRDLAAQIGPETVLVTPESDRPFEVAAVRDDRIVIHYLDGDGERTLRRDQFAVLRDRLLGDPDGISLSGLPSGVEPYVSVLSLSSRYEVDGGANVIRAVERGEGTESPEEVAVAETEDAETEDAEAEDAETADGDDVPASPDLGGDREREQGDEVDPERSPFLRPEWTARTPPERVHDDALLLAELLGRHDADEPEELTDATVVDLYVLLSDTQRGADQLRRALGDELLDRVGPDGNLHGQYGTVSRTTRERRRPRSDEVVFAALEERSIPREWVTGVDPDKLDVVLAATDLEEAEVYDVEEQVYAQKTSVEESEKQERLAGLRERLAVLDTQEADELHAEIDDLEARLDDLLAAA